MYFSANDIIENLKCPICDFLFERKREPRVLPCGNCVCSKCLAFIRNQKNTYASIFRCVLCKKIHQIPKNGFSSCKPLIKILYTKPNKLQLLEENDIKYTMNLIENKIKTCDFKLKHGQELIKEHCDELRKEVESSIKIKQKEILNLGKNLIKKIDNYESESIQSYNTSKSNIKIDAINDIKLNYQKLDLKENEIINKLKDIKNLIDLEEFKIKKLIFSNKLNYFDKSKNKIDGNFLGELKTVSNYDSIDFKLLNSIDLNSCFLNKLKFCDFYSGFLTNNDYVLIYLDDKKNIINVLIIDIEGKMVKKYNIINEVEEICEVCISNNIIIIQFINLMQFDINENKSLIIFDQDLNILNKLISKYLLIGVNSSYIFFQSNDENTTPIIVYDFSFNLVKTFGQRLISNNPFYFPLCIMDFFSENGKYIIHTYEENSENIRIIDKSTGSLLNKFKIKNAKIYKLDNNDNLIIVTSDDDYGNKNLNLKYYNLNGLCQKEFKLISFPETNEIRIHRFLSFNSNYTINYFNIEHLTLHQ